jgi:hypothetical protein
LLRRVYGLTISVRSTRTDSTYKDQIQQVSASACHQRRGHLAEEDHLLRCQLEDLLHRPLHLNWGLLHLLHLSCPQYEEPLRSLVCVFLRPLPAWICLSSSEEAMVLLRAGVSRGGWSLVLIDDCGQGRDYRDHCRSPSSRTHGSAESGARVMTARHASRSIQNSTPRFLLSFMVKLQKMGAACSTFRVYIMQGRSTRIRELVARTRQDIQYHRTKLLSRIDNYLILILTSRLTMELSTSWRARGLGFVTKGRGPLILLVRSTGGVLANKED